MMNINWSNYSAPEAADKLEKSENTKQLAKWIRKAIEFDTVV